MISGQAVARASGTVAIGNGGRTVDVIGARVVVNAPLVTRAPIGGVMISGPTQTRAIDACAIRHRVATVAVQ